MRKIIAILVILFALLPPRDDVSASSEFPVIYGQWIDDDSFTIVLADDMKEREFVLVNGEFISPSATPFDTWATLVANAHVIVDNTWWTESYPFGTDVVNTQSWIRWASRTIRNAPKKFNHAYGLEDHTVWVEGNNPDGSVYVERVKRVDGSCKWVVAQKSRRTPYPVLARAIAQMLNTGSTNYGVWTPEWWLMKSWLGELYHSPYGCGPDSGEEFPS